MSSKVHAVVNAKGLPLHLERTPGQRHEATVADWLIEHAQGRAFISDTGYDSVHIREAAKACGIKPVVPSHPTRKRQQRYGKRLDRIRYRVEYFFHNLKRCRRITTRYDKTGRAYLAFVHLAAALIWLA